MDLKRTAPLMTKAELVAMDESFIYWLSQDPLGYEHYCRKHYISIFTTSDNEVSIAGHDTLKEVQEHLEDSYADDDNWNCKVVYDLKNRKKIPFTIKTVITVGQ